MSISQRTILIIFVLVFAVVALIRWYTTEELWQPVTLFLSSLVCVGLILVDDLRSNDAKVSEWLRRIGLLPRPTEASMLVLGLTSFALITLNNLWPAIFDSFFAELTIVSLAAVYVFLGMFLSIYHAFSSRILSTFEAITMKVYLLVTLVFLTFSTAVRALVEQRPAYAVVAIWSMLQCVTLVMILHTFRFNHIVFSSRGAQMIEAFLAVLVVAGGVYVGQFAMSLHWSVTFSITIAAWAWIQVFFENKTGLT